MTTCFSPGLLGSRLIERIVLFNKLPPTFVTEAFVEQLGVISDVGDSEGEDGPGLHYDIHRRTERTRHVSLLSTVDTYTHFGKAKRKKAKVRRFSLRRSV